MNEIDTRTKMWIITDTRAQVNTVYTTSDPLLKINRYLFAKELEADTWYDELTAETAKARHQEVYDWFKGKHLDEMHIGESYFYDNFTVKCVELED